MKMEGILHFTPFKKNPYYTNMRWLNISDLNEAGEKNIMENPRQKIEQEMLAEIGKDLGFAAVKEREIYERLDKKDNFFTKIEGFLTSIFSSLAISMISAVLILIIYKTACCCILLKKCKKNEDNGMEMEDLEGKNERIQKLVERITALESESASLLTLEEDEKRYQKNKRDEQEQFNILITDNIHDMLFIITGLIRAVGLRTRVRDIIKRQIDESFNVKLENKMRSWKKYENEHDQPKTSEKTR